MFSHLPSAERAHVWLCVALCLVKASRAFAQAIGRVRVTSSRAARALGSGGVFAALSRTYWTLAASGRALELAPGTTAHYAWTLVPSCAFYGFALRADGRADDVGALGALAALVAGVVGGRRVGSLACFGIGMWSARTGHGDLGMFIVCVAFGIARRLALDAGDEVYFTQWAGTVTCEAVALACVEFDVFSDSRARAVRLKRRREDIARIIAAKKNA